MRILLVTMHYPPILGMSSRGMAELSKVLCQQGHAVDVLTTVTTPGHPVYKFNFSEMRHVHPRVNVHRVPMGPVNRMASRLLGGAGSQKRPAPTNVRGYRCPITKVRPAKTNGTYARLYQARKILQAFMVPDANADWIPMAVLEARRMLRSASYDLVVSFGYPHTAHCVAYLALRGRDIPWVMMHAEGWATNPCMEELPRWSRKLHRVLDSKLSETAARIVFCGWAEGLLARFTASEEMDSGKLRFAQFSFVDHAPYDSAVPLPTRGLHMVYTGSFYREHGQDPRELFEAMKIVASDEIQLSILGERDRNLELFVRQREIKNVEFLGWCWPEMTIAYQISANVLVGFGCRGGQLVPSKVYEYFMARSPILCIAADEHDLTGTLVKRHGRGVVVPNSRKDIARALSELLDMQRSGGLESHFNLESLPQYATERSAEELMCAVLGEERPHTSTEPLPMVS